MRGLDCGEASRSRGLSRSTFELDARPVLRPLAPVAAEGRVVNPIWLEKASRLAPFDEKTTAKPRLMEPLLDPRRTRALLTEALSTAVEDGPPDIAALEDRIRRAQPVIELPQLPRRSLDSGVQVLVDRAEMLTPYHADQLARMKSY